MKRLSTAFSYIFSDNEWFNKVLVGGFFFLLIPFGIGIVMINGFIDEFVQGLKKGDRAMPYWRNYRTIVRRGIAKSLFGMMALVTIIVSLLMNQLTFTVTTAILLLAISLSINTAIVVGRFGILSLLLSFPLLLVAISIGWMWIVVGWPLLIFLSLLVQAHLFSSTLKQF